MPSSTPCAHLRPAPLPFITFVSLTTVFLLSHLVSSSESSSLSPSSASSSSILSFFDNNQATPIRQSDDSNFLQLPLEGGLLHASGYFFNATIGGQHFTLQVDISYSSLIIPTHKCKGCRLGDRRYHADNSADSQKILCSDGQCHSKLDSDCPLTTSQSSRTACYSCSTRGRCCVLEKDNKIIENENDDKNKLCAYNVIYGDGSAGNGSVYTDKLKLIDSKNNNEIETNVLFAAMFEESHNFEMPYADGVFGLAFQKGSCKPTCFQPLMDQISNSTNLADIFTLCTNRYGGMLTLGKADKTLIKPNEDFLFVDVVEKFKDDRFVIPSIPEWKVNDKSIDMPGITTVMFTAGISQIMISKTSFMALIEHLTTYYCDVPNLCSISSWFRPQGCTVLDDKVLAMMPNITLSFTQRVSITLTPEDYLLPYKVIRGKQIRCVAFSVSESLGAHGIGMLLGNTVYKRYSVVFDRQAKRVGFGLSVGEPLCGSSNGSDIGLPIMPGELVGDLLTADAPAQPITDEELNNDDGEVEDEKEETCRSLNGCRSCASNKNCSYGYESGDCVPIEDSEHKRPYPYCAGGFCACFATGKGGWYVGIALGALLCLSCTIVVWFIWKKRQQRNLYSSVNSFEEQDLDTF